MIVAAPGLAMGTSCGVLLPSDANRFESVTCVDVLVVVGAICNVTVARTPLAIAVLLKPATTHRMSPDVGVPHVACFPASVAAAPVA